MQNAKTDVLLKVLSVKKISLCAVFLGIPERSCDAAAIHLMTGTYLLCKRPTLFPPLLLGYTVLSTKL